MINARISRLSKIISLVFFVSLIISTDTISQAPSIEFTSGIGFGHGDSRNSVWGDYDNDGYQDVLVVRNKRGGLVSVSKLFHNNGDGTFTENTTLISSAPGFHAVWADFNNDYLLDLFISLNNGNELFINDGDGTFTLSINSITEIFIDISVADYDLDGYVDIVGVSINPTEVFVFKNDGTGVFSKMILDNSNVNLKTFSVHWFDYNDDSWPDIYLGGSLGSERAVFINNADGTFSVINLGTTNYIIYNVGFGDYDNDLDLDYATANGILNNIGQGYLYTNNSDGNYSSQNRVAFSNTSVVDTEFIDLDNDGFIEYLNTVLHLNYGLKIRTRASNHSGIFRFLRFDNQTNTYTSETAWHFSWADIDNDGDVDCFATNPNSNLLYFNETITSNSWLTLNLKGMQSNTFGVGAKIKTFANGNWQMSVVSANEQNNNNAHFGLGAASIIDRLVVEWPSGIVQELTNVAVNQFLTITEPAPPTVPTNLTASVVSNSQVNLSWQDVNFEDEYYIERSVGDNTNFTQIATVGVDVTSYSDTSIGSGTYYYRMRASNTNGTSSYSNEASATTLPSAPSSLNATTVSDIQIDLTWIDNSTTEEGFVIERSQSDNTNFTVLNNVGQGVVNYSDTNLTPETTYYYRVSAVNSSGNSAYSNEVNATTICSIPLQPTSNSTSLAYSDVRDTRMKLTWTKGNGAKRLVVARKSSAVNKVPVDGNTSYNASTTFGGGHDLGNSNYVVYNGTGNTVTVTGLTASSIYHYAIYEYNEDTGCYLDKNYLTSSMLIGSKSTLCSTSSEPTLISSNVNSWVIGPILRLNWVNGNGVKRLIIARQGSAVNKSPVDGNTNYNANNNFGSGYNFGNGNYVVYNGTGSGIFITGLSASSTYHYAIYEYNEDTGCYVQRNYLTSSKLTGSETTSCITTEPTVKASNMAFNVVTTSSMSFSWIKGNGNRRIVIARKNYAVNRTPTDNITYSSSSTFGNGTNLGSSNYVIYDGTGSFAFVNGLTASSTYHYAIYEYNLDYGCLPTRNYSTLKLFGSRSTLSGGGGGGGGDDPCLLQRIEQNDKSSKGSNLQSRLLFPKPCDLARVYNKGKTVHIDFSSNLTAKSEIQVFDLNGRLVKHIDNTQNQNINVKIDFYNVSDNTIYLIRVTNEYEVVTKKLVLR